MFFSLLYWSHIKNEDGIGWKKYSYAKWETNELKVWKYSDCSRQRLDNRYSARTRRVSFCCLPTPIRRWQKWKHNDCIFRLCHILQWRNLKSFSLHSRWSGHKFIIQSTYSCFTTCFIFYFFTFFKNQFKKVWCLARQQNILRNLLSSNVFFSWYGFPGRYRSSFLFLFPPPPPPPPWRNN